MKSVDTDWLEENVLASQSDPAIVYVSGDIDVTREVHLPLLEAAESAHDHLTVVEVDYHEEFAERLQVCYVPTIFFFRKGDLMTSMSGVVPAGLLEQGAKEAAKKDAVDDLLREVRERQVEQ